MEGAIVSHEVSFSDILFRFYDSPLFSSHLYLLLMHMLQFRYLQHPKPSSTYVYLVKHSRVRLISSILVLHMKLYMTNMFLGRLISFVLHCWRVAC